MKELKYFPIFCIPLLHFVYLLIAAIVGFWGVFLVGVPAVGDNPIAAAAGIIPFLGTYLCLVALESGVEAILIRKKSLLRATIEIIISIISACLASISALCISYFLFTEAMAPIYGADIYIFLFLVFEYFVLLGAKYGLSRYL